MGENRFLVTEAVISKRKEMEDSVKRSEGRK